MSLNYTTLVVTSVNAASRRLALPRPYERRAPKPRPLRIWKPVVYNEASRRFPTNQGHLDGQ